VKRVIKSFGDRQTERLWTSLEPGKLPAEIQQRALNKLAILDQSKDLNDLRIPPSNRLETLKGNRTGKFSIRINQQWRICFRWDNGDAHDVVIEDYH
jgi:proteic killer suppression protein